MQFNIDSQIETLKEALEGAINELYPQVLEQAETSPETPLVLNDELLQSIIDVAIEQNTSVRETVLEAITLLVPNATDNNSLEVEAGMGFVVTFFARKTLIESINRIHSAAVFTQVIEDDRQDVINSALERSLTLAEDVAINELSGYAAKYDELDAIENGFSYYQYETSHDEAVRDKHTSRQGKYFKYGAARVVDDIPAMAYRCRCVAIARSVEEAENGEFYYPEDSPNYSVSAMKQPPKHKEGDSLNLKYKLSAFGFSGDVGDWWMDTDFDGFRYRAEHELARTGELSIDMTSHGGLYMEGAAMYSFLNQKRAEGKKITFNIVGYCGSAATLPMCAATHVTADISDSILIHNATGGYIGAAEGFDGARDETIDANTAMMEIYKRKTGRTEKEIRDLMAEDRYISAARALDFGLIDEIRGQTSNNQDPEVEGFFNEGDFMSDAKKGSESNDDYLQQIGALKEQLKASNEANEALVAENTVLAQKIEEVPTAEQIESMIADGVAANKTADAELSAIRSQVKELGLSADGQSPHELRVNALVEAGIDGAGDMKEIAASAAFGVFAKYGAKAADVKEGATILGKKPEEVTETRAQRANRLRGDK